MTRKHFTVFRHFSRTKTGTTSSSSRSASTASSTASGTTTTRARPPRAGQPLHRRSIRDYYRQLDEEIGRLLELLTDDTIVAGRLRPWRPAARRRLLRQRVAHPRRACSSLNHYPDRSRPSASSTWTGTGPCVWSEGGYYARVFFNVKGREPRGVIEPGRLRSSPRRAEGEVRGHARPRGQAAGHARLQARGGLSRGPRVAPDLIVHFGGLDLAVDWRGRLPGLHVQENDTGPDDCNHASTALRPRRARRPRRGRGRRGPPPRHRPDAPGTGRLRRPRFDARPVARGRPRLEGGCAATTAPDAEEIASATVSAGWVYFLRRS